MNRSHEDTDTDAALTVVIVNYNSWKDTLRLVSSLLREQECTTGICRVVVVDNASSQPIPQPILSLAHDGLKLVARSENGGFAVGVNEGWKLAGGSWLLLLNPDIDIESGLLRKVLDRIERCSSEKGGPPGIVGFGLRNSDGSNQGSVGVFPSLARMLREQFIPRRRRKYRGRNQVQSGPVDWVTGAFMLVNPEMIAELGGMDEDFFLYYEEVAFSRSAQDRGWRVEYDSSLNVVHRHPLQNREVSPRMRVITRHSKLLYFKKHRPKWEFLALCRIVRAEAMVRAVWSHMGAERTECRAWQTVGMMSRDLCRGGSIYGRSVLRLAEAIDREDLPRTRRIHLNRISVEEGSMVPPGRSEMAVELESSREIRASRR